MRKLLALIVVIILEISILPVAYSKGILRRRFSRQYDIDYRPFEPDYMPFEPSDYMPFGQTDDMPFEPPYPEMEPMGPPSMGPLPPLPIRNDDSDRRIGRSGVIPAASPSPRFFGLFDRWFNRDYDYGPPPPEEWCDYEFIDPYHGYQEVCYPIY